MSTNVKKSFIEKSVPSSLALMARVRVVWSMCVSTHVCTWQRPKDSRHPTALLPYNLREELSMNLQLSVSVRLAG